MNLTTRLLGALVATYFARRLFGLPLRGRVTSTALVMIANGLSLVFWFVVAGLVRSFLSPFNPEAGLIYVLPQIFWVVFDLWTISVVKRR